MRRTSPLLYFLPILALIVVIVLVPELLAIYISVSKSNLLITLAYMGPRWYVYLLSDSRFANDMAVSLYWMVTTVVISYFVGLLLALVFGGPGKLDKAVRFVMLVIWVMMPVATGLAWRFMYSNTGVLDTIFYYLNLPQVDFFVTPFVALNSVLVALVWRSIPIAMIFLWAGLKSIDSSIIEATMLDGASQLNRLRYVTFPLLRGATLAVLILLLLTGAFTVDLPYTLTGGGPYFGTENLAMRIYLSAFANINWALSSTLGVIALLFALVVLSPVLRGAFKRA